jgi:hypothetical protein
MPITAAELASAWATYSVESTWHEVPPVCQGGRWVVILKGRGCRVRSLSNARRIAKRLGGKVRRYHAKHWGKPSMPMAYVKTWVKSDTAFAMDVPP